jgi:PII-like signaling protein
VTLRRPAPRLTIFIKDTKQWHLRQVYNEVVRRAHEAALAGARVICGIEGYGKSQHIHTSPNTVAGRRPPPARSSSSTLTTESVPSSPS